MLGAAAGGGGGSGPLSEERVLGSRRQVESGRRPPPDNGLGVFTWISGVWRGRPRAFPWLLALGFHPGSSPGDRGNRSKETTSDGGPAGTLLRFPNMWLGLTQKVSCNFSGF